jgi:hypothetical protein
MWSRSLVGVWAALTILFGAVAARGDMGPVASDGTELQTIELIGCPVFGHADEAPEAAPAKRLIKLSLRKGMASRMAVYRGALGPAVFGPRGWHCFARYGSGAFVLDVRPEPFNASGEAQGGPFGSNSRAISVEIINGGTSGRYEAAPIIARLFPEFRSFAEEVRDMGGIPRSEFVFAPYPNDRVITLAYNVVEFETPGNSEGIGTRGGFVAGPDSIKGIASVSGSPSEPSVRVMRARLGSQFSDVTEELMRLVSLAALGKADVYSVVSENSDVDWSTLPGEWSRGGACDRQRTVVSVDGSWSELERVTGEAWEKRGPYVYEVLPFETKICVGERGTDNISCRVVSKLDRVHFESKSVLDPDGTGEIVEEKSQRCDQVQGLKSDQPQTTVEIESVDDRTYLISRINGLLLAPYAKWVLLILGLAATVVAVSPSVSNTKCILGVVAAILLFLLWGYAASSDFRNGVLLTLAAPQSENSTSLVVRDSEDGAVPDYQSKYEEETPKVSQVRILPVWGWWVVLSVSLLLAIGAGTGNFVRAAAVFFALGSAIVLACILVPDFERSVVLRGGLLQLLAYCGAGALVFYGLLRMLDGSGAVDPSSLVGYEILPSDAVDVEYFIRHLAAKHVVSQKVAVRNTSVKSVRRDFYPFHRADGTVDVRYYGEITMRLRYVPRGVIPTRVVGETAYIYVEGSVVVSVKTLVCTLKRPEELKPERGGKVTPRFYSLSDVGGEPRLEPEISKSEYHSIFKKHLLDAVAKEVRAKLPPLADSDMTHLRIEVGDWSDMVEEDEIYAPFYRIDYNFRGAPRVSFACAEGKNLVTGAQTVSENRKSAARGILALNVDSTAY